VELAGYRVARPREGDGTGMRLDQFVGPAPGDTRVWRLLRLTGLDDA
jgi:hypothetical protein